MGQDDGTAGRDARPRAEHGEDAPDEQAYEDGWYRALAAWQDVHPLDEGQPTDDPPGESPPED